MLSNLSIEPIIIQDQKRIRVNVPYDGLSIQKIRRINGRKWNSEQKFWHIPYTKEAYGNLKKQFPDIEIKNTNKSFTKLAISNSGKETEEINKTSGDKIIVKEGVHGWLNAYVPWDKKGWIETIKQIHGRKWMTDGKFWLLPNVKNSYEILEKHIGLKYLNFSFPIPSDIPECFVSPKKSFTAKKKSYTPFIEKLAEAQKNAIIAVEEQLTLERLSYSTIKAYRHHLARLFYYYKDFAPEMITSRQLQQYLLHRIKFNKISESTQNQIINAVKAYWERILEKPKEWIEIPRPKRPKKMPNVLSTQEIVDLLNSVDNLKHKLILLLTYSSGLRRSEVINLLKIDINIKRQAIHIKGAKGKKDRYVLLAENAIPYLKDYLNQYKPVHWLFEGQYGGRYSATSVQKIFTKALQKSKANPYATLHTLRHSYATHCIEAGHSLKHVQDALGHECIKTTEIYLHINTGTLNRLKSPFDRMDLE